MPLSCKILVRSTGFAALLAGAALPAFAQVPITQTPINTTPVRVRVGRVLRVTDSQSDAYLIQARKALQTAVSQLQQGLPIYDGHRVRSIEIARKAIAQINAGLRYDHSYEQSTAGRRYSAAQIASSVPRGRENARRRYNQQEIDRSNAMVQSGGQSMASAQAQLNQAAHDYDGHRNDAAEMTGYAMTEAQAALTFVSAH
jgi:hypothetical protein